MVEANEEFILIGDWRPVVVETVSHAVGLNDVTGKSVFEGDYVEVYDSYNNRSFNGVIEYKDASYAVVNEESSNYRLMDYDLKIIPKEECKNDI